MEYNPSYSDELYGDYIPSYNDSLTHHGVLGMKWGVRRYQNSDGSYTAAGKQHRQETSNRKDWYKSDNYEKQLQMYKDAGKEISNFSKQHKREIATGAALAASALAMYGGYKMYKKAGTRPSGWNTYGVYKPLSETLDGYSPEGATIKKGQKLQRVSPDAMEDFKNKGYTYVSYKFRDNQYYKSDFTKEVSPGISHRDFVHDIRPKRDLKFASPRTVAETALSINPKMKDDKFRYDIADLFASRLMYDTLDDDARDEFYRKQQNELIKRLKEQGYDGYVDFEDQSKRKGSQPLIIFDPDEVATVKSSRKIGRFESFVASKLK